jgi:5-methylcytosine-specific restriction endonuclease McrA
MLHIVQGGVENGDKRLLERARRRGAVSSDWVAPKRAVVGDDVVIYIGGYGLFATGKITSSPRPRRNWANRYGARVAAIRLIDPPISLETLRRALPDLKWALYPRSIVTPAPELARALLALIHERRRFRGAEIDEESLKEASLEELRAAALRKSVTRATAQQKLATVRKRIAAIKRYAVMRAGGQCEFCGEDAPFLSRDGRPYLESHHILRMSDDGPDHPRNVIGVCPNCHRRAHYARDRVKIKGQMKRRVAVLERRAVGSR